MKGNGADENKKTMARDTYYHLRLCGGSEAGVAAAVGGAQLRSGGSSSVSRSAAVEESGRSGAWHRESGSLHTQSSTERPAGRRAGAERSGMEL
ncbi:hypothetical protein EXN66_Car021814 [Channa argus]|uniref:Uncharacterized protein n=1 Tax=Channa argus TaxID=215402 RepID=A0A6G1QUZ3_CHAAH|nr:hypothetical protein EXN66_Car021814 [Channa argus]